MTNLRDTDVIKEPIQPVDVLMISTVWPRKVVLIKSY